MRLNARKYYHRLHSVPPVHYVKRIVRAGGCPVVVALWHSTGCTNQVPWVSSHDINEYTIVHNRLKCLAMQHCSKRVL